MAEWLLRQFGRLVPLRIVGSNPTFSEQSNNKKKVSINILKAKYKIRYLKRK